MAQQITFWKIEGKSDVEVKTIRLKNKSEIANVMANTPEDADCATLYRTDKQSKIMHTIWSRKGYIDLNDR